MLKGGVSSDKLSSAIQLYGQQFLQAIPRLLSAQSLLSDVQSGSGRDPVPAAEQSARLFTRSGVNGYSRRYLHTKHPRDLRYKPPKTLKIR